MPAINFSNIGGVARKVHREWKETLRKHNSYLVRNKYHQKKDMDGWNKKQQEINSHYRKQLKELENEAKERNTELMKMQEEEARILKIAEAKKKEAEIKKKNFLKEVNKLSENPVDLLQKQKEDVVQMEHEEIKKQINVKKKNNINIKICLME